MCCGGTDAFLSPTQSRKDLLIVPKRIMASVLTANLRAVCTLFVVNGTVHLLQLSRPFCKARHNSFAYLSIVLRHRSGGTRPVGSMALPPALRETLNVCMAKQLYAHLRHSQKRGDLVLKPLVASGAKEMSGRDEQTGIPGETDGRSDREQSRTSALSFFTS